MKSDARIVYENWRGEVRERAIRPRYIFFGESEWHEGEQWILEALDLEKKVNRQFAMTGILRWRPLGGKGD